MIFIILYEKRRQFIENIQLAFLSHQNHFLLHPKLKNLLSIKIKDKTDIFLKSYSKNTDLRKWIQ